MLLLLPEKAAASDGWKTPTRVNCVTISADRLHRVLPSVHCRQARPWSLLCANMWLAQVAAMSG